MLRWLHVHRLRMEFQELPSMLDMSTYCAMFYLHQEVPWFEMILQPLQRTQNDHSAGEVGFMGTVEHCSPGALCTSARLCNN